MALVVVLKDIKKERMPRKEGRDIAEGRKEERKRGRKEGREGGMQGGIKE